MEKKKDYKGVLVFALVLAIVFMSVGYAALAQRLTVNGTATIGDASWNVKITKIEFDSSASTIDVSNSTHGFNPAEAAVGKGSTGVEFTAPLEKPGDKAVYKVTVSNLGTISAQLNEITNLATINAANPADITFNVTGATVGEELAPETTQTFTITVEWNAAATEVPEAPNNTKTATINFDYVQFD